MPKRYGGKTIVYGLFFTVQLLYPLVGYFIPGNIAWHRQGYYFSWRMMLNNHQVKGFQFMVEMPDVHEKYWVDFEKLLTFRQFSNTYHDPYHIWLLAQKLKTDAEKKYGSKDVRVYCHSLVSLNGRPPRLLVNDTVNLARTRYHLYTPNTFINEYNNNPH